jgi:hypothetical protein
MIIFKEHNQKSVTEKTIYSPSGFAEMTQTLVHSLKKGEQIRAHYGKLTGVSFMEAQYQKMKVTGQEIRLYSNKSVNDRCSFYIGDIIEIEKGEEPDIGYITFRVIMKDKTFVSVTPLG